MSIASRARTEKRPTARTTGGKNAWKRKAWFPHESFGNVTLKSGTRYVRSETGALLREHPQKVKRHIYGERWPVPKAKAA